MRTLKRVVTLSLLVGIGVLIARREGFATMIGHVRDLSPAGLVLALLMPLVAVIASVRRWQLLLDHEDVSLPYPTLMRSFLRGRFVGAFTPSTTGLDLYRLVDIAKRTGRKAASGRAILVEKLYGLVALALVTMLLLPVGLARFFGAAGILLAVGIGLGAVLLLMLMARPRWIPFQSVPKVKVLSRSGEPVEPKAERQDSQSPKATRIEGSRESRKTNLEKLVDVLTTRPMSFAQHARVLGLGVVSHTAAAATFVGTGLALHVDASVFELLVVGNAIVLATLVPISVGGIGVREGTAVAVLATIGVSPSLAALVGFLGYLVMQPPALAGGLLALKPGPATSPGTIAAA